MRAAGERRYPKAPGFVSGSATSKAAAEAMEPKLSELQLYVRGWFRMAGPEGMTDAELQEHAPTGTLLRPRRCELFAKRIIKDSGTTRKGPSGKPMTVWVLA